MDVKHHVYSFKRTCCKTCKFIQSKRREYKSHNYETGHVGVLCTVKRTGAMRNVMRSFESDLLCLIAIIITIKIIKRRDYSKRLHARTHARTHHTRARTQTDRQTDRHTHTHTRARTHARTHTHMFTHTHTPVSYTHLTLPTMAVV